MVLFRSKRLTPIGLDIGTGAIKMAQLQMDGDGCRVAALARRALSANEDSPEERKGAIQAILSDLLRRGEFRRRDVTISLNAQQIFVQNVRVPAIPIEELPKVVRWEAEERLPDHFGEAEVRYLLAGDVRPGPAIGERSEARREVILMACRRKDVNDLIGICETVGLRPQAIDSPACALVRGLYTQIRRKNHQTRRKSDEQTGLLFVDIGAGVTTVVASRAEQIVLIKTLPIGGRSMDRQVAQKLNLNIQEAATVRRQCADGDGAGVDPSLARSVREAIRSEIEALATELVKCIRYHGVTFRGNRLAKALFYGGEASPGLTEQFTQKLDIPCELADPFGGLQISDQQAARIESSRPASWAVALGLCTKPRRGAS